MPSTRERPSDDRARNRAGPARPLRPLPSGWPDHRRGQRGKFLRRQGRDGGAGGRKRVRQIGDGAGNGFAAARQRHGHGIGALQRCRNGGCGRAGPAPGARQQHQLYLSGADDKPEPPAHHPHAAGRKPCAASGPDRGCRAGTDHRAFAKGRHPRGGKPTGRLSAPVVGRAAAAGDDCHGDGQRAGPAYCGRADHGTGCDHPGADSGASGRSQADRRVEPALHHP